MSLRGAGPFFCHAIFLSAALASVPARADVLPDSDMERPPPPAREAKQEAPIVAFTYSAFGTQAGSYGAQGYGDGIVAPKQKTVAGGGALAWGSPIDRLTLVVDAPRDVYFEGHFAPSAAAIVRLFGNPGDGFALGALGKYKVEGFGTDPNGDIESEVEGGLLFSYAARGLHLDANTITGFGLTEEGEIDTEARLRLGYDVARLVRVGIDGQGRYRLAGTKRLPNGASYDFAGGPQVVVGMGQFFGALTAGPATMGIASANVVGATAMISICGMM